VEKKIVAVQEDVNLTTNSYHNVESAEVVSFVGMTNRNTNAEI
jgi:hypothetical protein